MTIQSILKLALLACLTHPAWGAVPQKFIDKPSATQSNETSYKDGLKKLVAGDLSGAEKAFYESQKHHPNSASPLLGLAEVAFKRQQIDQAGTLIKRAVETEPDNAYAQTSLGRYLRLKKQYPEAEQAFRKATDKDPKAIDPRMALGDLYLTQLGKPEAAVSAYEAVLNIDPKKASAHYAMGVAQAKLGNNDRAIAELRKAGELEPKNPLPSLELARVYLLLNKADEALAAADQSIKIDPDRIENSLLRGDILLAKGDAVQAEKVYSRLASKHSKLTAPLLRLAMLQQQLGKNKEAIKSYQSVITIEPKLALAYNNLAWLFNTQKENLAEAEKIAGKAVELAPDEAQFYDTLGWIYRANGKLAEARAALEKGVQLTPDDRSIIAHLGIVLGESNEQSKAVELLQKALAKDKNFLDAADAEAALNKLNAKP